MGSTDIYGSYGSAMFFAPPTHNSDAGPSHPREDGLRMIAHVGPYGELTWYSDYSNSQPQSPAPQASQKRKAQSVSPFYGHYPTPLEPIIESQFEGEAQSDLPPRPRRRQTSSQRASTASPSKAKPVAVKSRTHSRSCSDTSLSSQTSSESDVREVNRLVTRLSDISLYSTPSLTNSGPPSPNSAGIQTPPLSHATVPKDLEMDYDADFIEDVYAAFEFANKDALSSL